MKLRADPRLTKQTLLNLLTNAVKFTPQGGSVTIAATRRPDGGIEITVSDTGIGIRPEDIQRALEPFAQVGDDAKRRAEGTGLGLALARSMTATDYIHAQRIRRRLCDHVDRALSDVDVIATPATACTAPPLAPDALAGGESNLPLADKIIRFVRLANLTGSPAISFPAGYDPEGLPVGLHLMGRPWEEHTLLRVAAVAEGLLPRRRPEIFFPLL